MSPRPAASAVLLTRAAEDNAAWAKALSALGWETRALPCIRTAPRRDAGTRAALADALGAGGWLALTSRRAVDAVDGLLGTPSAPIACVGDATAAAARARWGVDPLVSPQGTAADLAASLLDAGARDVTAALADRARPELGRLLRAGGARVREVVVYDTRPAAPDEAPIPDLEGVVAVVLASPSAVEGLLALLGAPPPFPAIALGPTTAAAARAAGLTPVTEADGRDVAAVARALDALHPPTAPLASRAAPPPSRRTP